MSWISRLNHLLRQFGDRENVSKGQHSDDFVQLYVDRLEERRVLSVTAALADGVLTIAGDGDADSVEVRLIDAGEDGSGASEEFIQILNNGTVVDISVMGSVPTIETQIATSQLHGNPGTQAGLKIELGDGADDLSLQIPTGASFGGDTLSILVNDDAQEDTLTLVDNGLDVDADLATKVSLTAHAGTILFSDADFNLGAVDLNLTGTLQLTSNQMLTTDGDFNLDGSVSQLAIAAPYDFNINLGENTLDISGDVGTSSDRLGAVSITADSVSVGSLFSNSLTVDLADDIGTFTTTAGDLNVTDGLSAEGTFSIDGNLEAGSLTLTGDTSFDAVGTSRTFDLGSITGAGFDLELTSFDEVEFTDNATGLGALTINASSEISLHDVMSNGLQSYTAANIITNSDYDTNGADFVMVGNWDVQTNSSVVTDGGDIDLSSAVLFSSNADVGLTLNSDTGTISLGAANVPMPPDGQLLHDVTIQNAEDVTFSGSPFNLAGAFTQTAGTGTTTLSGMIGVASLSATTANIAVSGGTQVSSTGEIALTSTSNSLVFSGTSELKANNGDGNINITGNVTGDANDNAEITFNGTTTIDGNIIGTVGSGIEQLNIQGGNLSVGSLNVAGGMTVESGSEVEANSNEGVIIGGMATLGGDVTTTFAGADIEIGGAVSLTESMTFSTSNGMVNIMGAGGFDGNAGVDVTFDSVTNVNGAIGSTLQNLIVTGGKLTADSIDITGDIQVDSGSEVEADGNAGIIIGGTATLGGNVSTTFDGANIQVGGSVTLTDSMTFSTFNGGVTVDSGDIEGDGTPDIDVTFDSVTDVNGAVGTNLRNLIVTGGKLTADSVNFSGGIQVDTGGEIEADEGDIIVGGTATLGGNVTASADGGQLTIAAGVMLTDSVTLSGDMIDITGDIEASGGMGMPNVTLFGTTDVSGTIGFGVGNLTVDGGTLTAGGIDIMGNLNVEAHPTDDTMAVLITDTDGISVDGDLVARGIINSAAAIDIGGVSSIGANITSIGTQSFGGEMTLTNDVTLQSNGVMTGLALNTVTGGGFALTLTSAGMTTFNGNVAGVTDLLVDGGGTTNIDTATIDVSNTLKIEETVTISQQTSLTAPVEVSITGPINSQAGEFNSLSITSAGDGGVVDSGNILFGDNVGELRALGSLQLDAATFISLHDVTTRATMTETGNQSYTSNLIATNSNYITNGGDFTMNGIWDVQSSSMVTTSGGNIDLGSATLTSSNVGTSLTLNSTNMMMPGGLVTLGEANDSEGNTLAALAVSSNSVVFTNTNTFEVGTLDVDARNTISLVHDITTMGDQSFQANRVDIEGDYLTNGGAFTIAGNMSPANVVLTGDVSVTSATAIPANNTAASEIALSDAQLSALATGISLTLDTGELADISILGADGTTGGELVDSLFITEANEVTLGSRALTFADQVDVQLATTVVITGALLAGTLNFTGNVDAQNSIEANINGITITGDLVASDQITSAGDLQVTGTSELGADVTADTIAFENTVTLTNDVTMLASVIEVTGDILGDTVAQHQLTLDGLTIVDGSIGGTTTIGDLIVTGDLLTAEEISISGDLTSDQDIETTLGGIDIGGNADLESSLLAETFVAIAGRLDAGGDITAEAGSVSLGTNPLDRLLLTGDVSLFATDMITLAGNAVSDLAGPHSLTLDATNGTTTEGSVGTLPQQINDLNVENGSLTSSGINIAGNLTAADSVETLNAGNIVVGGNLETKSTLTSDGLITVMGTSQLGGDVTSIGEQVYMQAVTLADDVVFTAADGLDPNPTAIRFASTLDEDAGATSSNATFNTPDDIIFAEAVGANVLLDSLTFTQANDVQFNETVAVEGDLTITTANNVDFDSTIAVGGNFLQSAGTGTTTFNGTSGEGIIGTLDVTTNNVQFETSQVVTQGTVTVVAANSISTMGMGGINAGAADISLTADADGTAGINGGEFNQSSGSSIQTDGNITIQVHGSGNASIANLIAGSSSGLVQITTGGAIVDATIAEAANITGFATALSAEAGIGDGMSPLSDIDTAVSQLAFSNTSTSAITQIENSGALTITETGGITESRSNAGGVVAARSPLTISMPTVVGGNMTFIAGNSTSTVTADDLTISADVTHLDGNGFIAFIAGDSILHDAGTISNTGGSVNEVRFLADNEGMNGDGFRGGITQATAAGIIANRASFEAFANISLNSSTTNAISTLAANVTGDGSSFSLTNDTDLTIGTVRSASSTMGAPVDVVGITTMNGDVSIHNGLSEMFIGTGAGQSIAAGNGTVALTAGGITERTGSIVSAANLNLSGTGLFNFSESNMVGTLAADVTGSLIFVDSDALVIGTVNNTGITTGGNNVTLMTGGLLTLGDGATANIDAGTENVFLNAAGVSEVDGSRILANGLELVGSGDFNLMEENEVSELAGEINGSLDFINVSTTLLTIGAVGDLEGLTITSPALTVNTISTGGALTLDEELDAAGTTISLTANGDITQTDDGIITADILGVVQDDAGSVPFDVDLCLDNVVGTLAGGNRSLGGAFRFHNDSTLSIGGNGTPTGVETNNGEIQITSTGALTVTDIIDSTAGVAGSTNGDILLSSDGSIDINSAVNAGFISMMETGDLFINSGGTVDIDGIVTADTLRIVSQGNVTQTQAFIVNTLGVRQESTVAGDITLEETNFFSTLAATNLFDGGEISVTSGEALTIATVSEITAVGKTPDFAATAGVASTDGDITLDIVDASLSIGLAGEDITAGNGTVAIDADGITQAMDSLITASALNLRGDGNVALGNDNNVDTLAADISGTLTFNDVDSLLIGTVLDDGIDTNGNDVVITTGGVLNLGDGGSQSITATGATVSLQTTSGGITQDASSIVTASELQVSGTGSSFEFAGGNQVDTLAADVAGEFDFTNTKELTVGTVTSALGTTAGISTVGQIRLTTTGVGSSLNIGTGAASEGLDSSGSSIFLTSSDTITLMNDVDAGTSALTTMNAQGTILQNASTVITTNRLAVTQSNTTTGDIELCGDNLVDLFAAQNDADGGAIRFHSENDLTVGTQPFFTRVEGVTSNFGDIEVTSAGTLTVDSIVNSNNMGGTGNGNIFLSGEDTVTINAAVDATFTSMVNTGDVFIVSGANILLDNTVTGDVVRLVSQGNVTQGSGDIVTANELAVRQESTTSGDITLGEANQVATFAAENLFDTGATTFTNDQALVIGTVAGLDANSKAPAFSETVGISTNNGDVTLTINGAGLTIGSAAGEDIDADSATVSISASGVTEESGSTITADHLELLGTGIFDLNEANKVGTLAANVDGDFSFVNDASLVVGTAGGTDGITTAGDDVRIEVTGVGNQLNIGDSNLDQNITTVGGNITLVSTGLLTIGDGTNGQSLDAGSGIVLTNSAGVTEAAGSTISATGLEIIGTGTFNLNEMNDVDTLAANIAGDLTYTNLGALTIGTVDGDDGIAANGSVGITTAGGDATVNAGLTNNGTLTVDDVVNTEDGASGTGGVVSVNSVELNAALVAGTGDITLNGGGCDLIISADQSTVSSATYQANCDIIIGAMVSTTGANANLTFTADADSDDAGGVQILTAGAVVATGNVVIEGSDLTLTSMPGVLDAVFIQADGSTQVDAEGSLTIQSRTTTDVDADIIIQGDINSDSGPINITANRDVVIAAEAVTGAGDITITAGDNMGPSGGVHVTTSGLINSAGNVTLTGSDLTSSMGVLESVRIADDGANDQVLAVGNVKVQAGANAPMAADLILDGQIHSTTGNVQFTSAQNILLATNVDADSGNVDFNSATILTGDAIATAGGTTTFAATIDDDGSGATGSDLTVSAAGTTRFNDAIGTGAAIDSLSTDNGGTTEVNGDIVVVNDIVFDDAVVLTNSVSMTSNMGSVQFNNTLDAQTGLTEQLTLTATMGDILFNGTVGTTELAALTITNVQDLTANESVSTGTLTQTNGSGTTTFNGAVTTSQMSGIDLTGTDFTFGDITGVDTVTTTGAGTVTISNSGLLTINESADFNLDGEFEQLGGGTVSLCADISTTDDSVTFADAVELTDDVLIITGLGNVLFTSIINDDGLIGTDSNLTITSAGTTRFNSSIGTTNSIDSLTLDGGGSTEFEGNVTTVNNITIDDAVLLTDSVTLTSTAGSVLFNSTVDSEASENNTLTVSAANQILFAGNVGTAMDGALGGITLDDATDIDFDQNVTLTGNLDIDTGAAGTVNFDGAVTTTNGGDVIISNEGELTLANAATFDLDGSFTQDGAGAVTTGADITTNNENVTFASAVTLTDNVAIDTGAGAGDITFMDDTSGAFTLMLAAGVGSVALSTIGAMNAVTGLTISSSTNTTLNGDINTAEDGDVAITHSGLLSIDDGATLTLGGSFTEDGTGTVSTGADITTTGDDVTFNSAVTLTESISIGSTGGTITFASTLNGTIDFAEDLTLNSDTGDILFSGVVGGDVDLSAISITQAKDVTFNDSLNASTLRQVAGTGTTLLNGPVILEGAGGLQLTTNMVTINSTVDTLAAGNGGTVTIVNAGQITLANAASFTLDGAFMQSGGGAVSTGADISTTGDNVTFTDDVTLTDDVIIDTGNGAGNITFSDTIDASSVRGEGLTLIAGTGNVLFDGAVGTTELKDLTITSAMDVTANESMAAGTLTQTDGSGTTTFNASVTTTQMGGITLNGTNFTFGDLTGVDNVTTTGGGNVSISNSGLLDIAANADFVIDGAFLQDGGGTIETAGDITTTGGTITFTDAVTLTDSGTVSLDTTNAGSVPAGADILFLLTLEGEADCNESLTLNAGTSGDITFTGNVGVTEPLGDVLIQNANDVTIMQSFSANSLKQVAGSGTATIDGNVTTKALAGVNLTTNVIDINANVDVTATALATITLDSAGNTTVDGNLLGDDGEISLTAGDSIAINGLLDTDMGAINLAAINDVTFSGTSTLVSETGDVNVTADSGNTGTGGVIRMTDGALIDAGSATITLSADGQISLGGLLTINNTVDAVAVTSQSADIIDAGNAHVDIVANSANAVVTLNAETGIGVSGPNGALETTISNVVATVDVVGGIDIAETDSLTIQQAVTADGAINIDAVGNLTVDDGGAAGDAVSAGSGGTVRLATNADLLINSEVVTTNASIQLLADNDVSFSNNAADNGNVSSTGGNITITADADTTTGGAITQDDGLSINAGDGEVTIQAEDDITLSNVVTTNAGANALFIQSDAGALLDGGETDVDLIANTGAALTTIRTATGVGTTANPLETSLVTLDLVNSTSGEIQLRETDAITLGNIEQNGAGITDIRSVGTLTADNGTGTGNAIVSNGAGAIHLEGTGAGSDVQVDDGISSTIGNIELIAAGAGGDVNVNGDVTTAGGNVTITAEGAVTTTAGDDITTTGQNDFDSGDVNFTATAGAINVAGEIVTTSNGIGNAGNIDIQTNGTADITITGDVSAIGVNDTNGGDVTVQAANGSIFLTNIDVTAGADAGDIEAIAGSTGANADITLMGMLTATGTNSEGAVSLDAASEIIDGNDGATLISTGDLSLTAGANIGEIDDFVARTGNAIDAEVSGLLQDLSIDDAGGVMHLKINGDLQAATGAIVPDADGAATLLLQTTGALDVGTNPGVLDLSTGDLIGFHAGTVLTLPDAGMNVGTGATGGTLRLSGGTDIVDPAGRELGKLTAQDLFFTSNSTGGATTINVDVDNLDVDLSGSPSGTNLTINNDGDMNVDSIITNDGDLLINNGNALNITSIVTGDAEVRINNSLAAGGGDISMDLINAGTGDVILDTTVNGGQLRDLNGAGTNVIAAGLATRTANIPATDVVDQTLEVQIDTLAASADNLGVKIFDQTGSLTIGTVDGLNGVTILNADVDDIIEVVTVGELNINQNVSSTGLGEIFLAAQGSANGNNVNLDATISKGGTDGDVQVIAGNDITLTSKSQITAANDSNVTLQAGVDIDGPDSSGTFINGSADADILMSDGSLISTETGTLTLNAANDVTISILDAGTGNVIVTADDSGLGGTSTNQVGEIRETLTQTTSTGEAANIIADDASLSAATGIGSTDDIELNVNSVDATNSTSGNIQLFEIVGGGDNDLTVNLVSNMQGNIDVQTGDGNLTIAGTVTTTDAIATDGTVNLVAGDDDLDGNGDLLIQASITTENGSVTLTSEGNNVEFTDDGDVTTTSGRVDITAGATDDSGNISQTSGSVINAGDDEVTLTANGQITLGNITTTSTSDQAVTLNADAGIDSSDPGNLLNIDAANGRLVINTERGVEPIRTTVDSLDLTNMTSGSITITETDALDVIKVDQNATTTSFPAGIDLTSGGTMTLVAGEAGVTGTDSPVNLTTTGAGSEVVINSTVQSTTGKITINAADNLKTGSVATVETNAAELLLVAGDALNGSSTTDGSIVMADGAEINGEEASIDLVADQDIQVGKITTTTDIRLTSLEAGISDSGDTNGVDLTAMNLGLDAATGIGSGNPLETSVELLAAENSTSGAIQVDNSGQQLLTIGTFDQSPESPGLGAIVGVTNSGNDAGQIGITNVGAINVDAIVTNSSGGNITLTATADGGDDDHLTINAQVSTAGAGGDISLNGGTDIDVNAIVVAQVDDVQADPNGLAGNVSLVAGRSIIIDAQVGATASDVDQGGNIEMTAMTGGIDVNAPITTPSSSVVEGGNITLTAAGEITIDAQVTASALTQVDPVMPADRTDVPIPNPNTSGNIVFNAGTDFTISDSGEEFDVDGNTITGRAGGKVTFGADVIVRSATGSIVDPTPSLSNVVTPQVTATGIAVIEGDFGRELENTFVYEISWQAGVSNTFSSGQVVTYVTPGMPNVNAPGDAAGSFIYDHMYFGNPDPLNPASPIPITITLFDDPNISFFEKGDFENEIGQVSTTSEAEVPGEGLAGAAVFDVSIEVPPLEAPRTVFTDSLETESNEISNDEQEEVLEGAIESEASRDELILIIQKISPDGKVERDQFGRPIQRTLYGGDAIELLTDLPELHDRLDSGHWKIFTKEGDDGQMMLVEDVILREGKPVVGDEGTQDRPPTSENNQPTAPEKMENPADLNPDSSQIQQEQPIEDLDALEGVPVQNQQSSKLGLLAMLPISSVSMRRVIKKAGKVKHLAGILIGILR